jgi:hypothetical protein
LGSKHPLGHQHSYQIKQKALQSSGLSRSRGQLQTQGEKNYTVSVYNALFTFQGTIDAQKSYEDYYNIYCVEHSYCLGAAGGFAMFAAPLKAALALPLDGGLAALLAPFTTTLAWPLDGGFALLPIFITALAWPLYGGFALLPIFTTELAWPPLDGGFTLLAPFTATLAWLLAGTPEPVLGCITW